MNVMVALDFSEQSLSALSLSVAWADRCGGTLTLVHVLEDKGEMEGMWRSPGEVMARWEEKARERMRGLHEMLGQEHTEVESREVVVMGHPVEELVRAVIAHRADLLVMGTTGVGRLEEWFVGSTANQMIRESPVPVMLVPKGSSVEVPGKLLVPVDFSENSERALREAVRVGEVLSALVAVSHTATMPTMPSDPFIGALATPIEERARGIRERLSAFVTRVVGRELEVRVAWGTPVEGIDHAAGRAGAQMVVMGTQGRRGWERLFVGSTTERYLRSTKVPVIVVAPEGSMGSGG